MVGFSSLSCYNSPATQVNIQTTGMVRIFSFRQKCTLCSCIPFLCVNELASRQELCIFRYAAFAAYFFVLKGEKEMKKKLTALLGKEVSL